MKLHHADFQRSDSRLVADSNINLASCHAPSSYQPLQRVADVNYWSGIIYPWTVRCISKINVYNITNKRTWVRSPTSTLGLVSQILAAVPLPVTIRLAIEASGSSCRRWLSPWSSTWDRVLSFASWLSLLLLIPRALLELSLILYHQHLTNLLWDQPLLSWASHVVQWASYPYHGCDSSRWTEHMH